MYLCAAALALRWVISVPVSVSERGNICICVCVWGEVSPGSQVFALSSCLGLGSSDHLTFLGFRWCPLPAPMLIHWPNIPGAIPYNKPYHAMTKNRAHTHLRSALAAAAAQVARRGYLITQPFYLPIFACSLRFLWIFGLRPRATCCRWNLTSACPAQIFAAHFFFAVGTWGLRRKLKRHLSSSDRFFFVSWAFPQWEQFDTTKCLVFVSPKCFTVEVAFNWFKILVFDGPLTSIHVDPFAFLRAKSTSSFFGLRWLSKCWYVWRVNWNWIFLE